MKLGALKKLTVEHLRGSVVSFSLDFNASKKLTVIYGENGTGKSTICDAFDLLGNGNVGSLDGRGLGKTRDYWHSVGKSASDVAVTLETTQNTWRATLGKPKVLVVPFDNRPRVQVFRRAQILSLLEATPSQRYVAIDEFINVSAVEAGEATLRVCIRDVEGELAFALARVQENRDAIQQFWQEAGSPQGNYLGWAEEQSRVDRALLDVQANALSNLVRAYEALPGFPARHAAAIKRLEDAHSALAASEQEIVKASTENTGDDVRVIGILQAAQEHFAHHTPSEACPLCESTERAQGLSERVNQRLSNFTRVREVTANHRQKEQELERAKQNLDTVGQLGREQAEQYEKASQDPALAEFEIHAAQVPQDLKDWTAWLNASKDLPAQWRQAEKAVIDKKQFLGTLTRALDTLRVNTQSAQELDAVLPRLKRALEIAQEERREFVDSTLSRIAKQVGELYEQIHPGEGLDKISLELDPKQRASLKIGTSFGSLNGLPPQAYFSESHLDTLGVCIFIALACMKDPDNTILVLDDVLASVDEPHVDRAIQMLYDESANFSHCIITTHYQAWKENYRWGDLQNGNCHFLELARWSPVAGMMVMGSVPETERLRLLLLQTPPDMQAIASKAGVLLENALSFLTLLYECSVPRRANNNYTLGDLLPNIDKKLRPMLLVEVLETDIDGNPVQDGNGKPVYVRHELKSKLDQLQEMIQIRNIFGAHFNELATRLPEVDALLFGQRVLELVLLLMDPDAGWPKKNKWGIYWHTTGETRRLYPVTRPT